MKPTLAVLGDSYMRPDADYPGLHFSEMLDRYDVHIYAQDGASMGMIAYQFDRACQDGMQAFIIGLGAHDRLEFWKDHESDEQNRLWYSGSFHDLTTPEQQQTSINYQLHACPGMSNYKTFLVAKSMFLDLEKKRIPFAWSWNLNTIDDHGKWFWLHHPVLASFEDRCTKLNLGNYRPFADKPGFHVPDRVWQESFAQQCREILESSLDFRDD